jgi:YD repeat-containing protein
VLVKNSRACMRISTRSDSILPERRHRARGVPETTNQIAYSNLDPVTYTDRQGRITQVTYDYLRRPVTVTDSAGRTTVLGWCGCNAIAQLTDANGNTTTWNRDVQGRVTTKTLPDGSVTQYFPTGETESANGADIPYYYTRDSLGSVRQLTDGTGAVVTSYDYDPWGRVTKIAGGKDAAFGQVLPKSPAPG